MNSFFPSVSSTSLVTILLACIVRLSQGDGCIQGVNCLLPDCFCPTYIHPLGAQNIPQIVYFGFDDAVQSTVSGFYNKLFRKNRKNPNGCPITMSLYASDRYTDYQRVHSFYEKGDEIAVHSVSHRSIETPSQLYMEAKQQKLNIEYYGGVPAKKIVGWRSPNLQTIGDSQPEVLKTLNYTYDNSLSYFRDLNTPFPFTLDYGFPYPCAILPCPSRYSSHKGFWEVMIRSFFNPTTGEPCGYVDGCRPAGEEQALEYLWWNFLQNYQNQRAPFGLNMHAAWFAFPAYMRAMDRFINLILSKGDVYIVNVSQMLEWMRTPVTLDEARYFLPWGCQGMNTTTSSTTSTTTTTTTPTTTTTTPTTTTTTTTPTTTTTTTPTTTTTTTTPITTTPTTTSTTSTTSTTTTPTTTTTTTKSPPTTTTSTTIPTTPYTENIIQDKGFLQYLASKLRHTNAVEVMTMKEQGRINKLSHSPTRAIMAP